MKKGEKKSIRTRLVQIFAVVSAAIFAINIYLYYNLNQTIREIDMVYNSNIQLNALSENIGKVQSTLYQYLNTKSSDSLEDYYRYKQDYQNRLKNLNRETIQEQTKLMEKNIYNMSVNYLEQTDKAVEAKRGRNITKFRVCYKEAEEIYQYIQSNINSLNTTAFLHNASDYSVLRTILNYSTGFGLIFLCGTMVLAIIGIVLMTRSITRPLVELADAATEIAKGNMEVDFPIVDTGDEITAVAKACNKMIQSIRDYIEQTRLNYERESQMIENELNMKNDLKEAQLKYLQAQINPHFLFNSLNAGTQLAMMEGAERTCMFIENMADFFRYNVRKMESDTTLREELQLVDSYIYILNVRFSGDIHYSKQIDERFLNEEMPGMILQPIIENAVNHGIREMEGTGEIWVRVYGDESEICITVSDNGKGIAPEIAEKIMRGESAHSQSEKDSAGIGLDNVINRLRRYYNKEEVFEIRRRESKGTEVTLHIPRGKESQKDD